MKGAAAMSGPVMGASERALRPPEEIFAHHAQALGAEDLDAIVMDYADDACIITPAGVTRGKEGIRGIFADLLQTIPRRRGASRPSSWMTSSSWSGSPT